jgi:hypothetical protein
MITILSCLWSGDMVNSARLWLVLPLVALLGCTTTPTPMPAAVSPSRLPFPSYVTSHAAETRGGAAWRGGQTEHALDPDGQSCGVAFDGRVRCWRRLGDPVTRPEILQDGDRIVRPR